MPFKNRTKKIILFSTFGNALEFYDFTISGVFIQQIAMTFFPQTNKTAALFGGIFAFSAGFFTRPLGAWLFGYFGDRLGRHKTLSVTIMLMGVPTFIIGVLPGYESMGLMAPVILVICRMTQGLCTGGEYNGAAVYALESTLGKKSGLISGLISSSCVIGALTATIFSFLINIYLPSSWGWRSAFLLGAFAAIFGFIFRRKMLESPEFKEASLKGHIVKNPLKIILKDYKQAFTKAIFAGAFNGVLSYTLFSFLSLYLTKFLGMKLTHGLMASIFGMFAFMVSCPIFGALCDKWGVKNIVNASVLASLVIPFPVFYLLQSVSMEGVILGQILLGILVGSFVGPSHYYLQGLFKPELRYTGVSLGFSLGMALTGGTTMMVMTGLIEKTTWLYIPPLIIGLYAAISFSVFVFLNGNKNTVAQKGKGALLIQ
jgi:MHS family proline/betaine transporter-like MFS transporter